VLGPISEDINFVFTHSFLLLQRVTRMYYVHTLGGGGVVVKKFYSKISFQSSKCTRNVVGPFSKDFQKKIEIFFRLLVLHILTSIIENVQFILFYRIKRKNIIIIWIFLNLWKGDRAHFWILGLLLTVKTAF